MATTHFTKQLPVSGRNNVVITRLILRPTGSYNQQFRRPWETTLDADTMLHIQERFHNASRFMPSMTAAVSNSFIRPQAAPESEILIPHGWETPRLCFMLEIEYSLNNYSGRLKEIVMGYTEYQGVNEMTGSVDENMIFTINSTMTTKIVEHNTPGIGIQQSRSITDNSLVIVNDAYNPRAKQRQETARPEDIMVALTKNELANSQLGTILDTRQVLTDLPIKSNRRNGIAANYMAHILDGYHVASSSAAYDETLSGVIETARGNLRENAVSNDVFMKSISRANETQELSNRFTMRDLFRMDNSFQARQHQNVYYVKSGTMLQMSSPNIFPEQHQTGQTENWHARNAVTVAATMLANAVPSLMMECLLTNLHFASNNRYTIGGNVVTAITNADGFVSEQIPVLAERFRQRFETEILPGLTWDNVMPSFELTMRADLLGETWIEISIEGEPMTPFVAPSFCDALTTPVITTDSMRVTAIAEDFDTLYQNLRQNTPVVQSIGGGTGNYTPGSL